MNVKHLYTLAAAAVLAAALSTPAMAQVNFGVSVGAPPPALRYEERGVAPGPGYVWTAGFYEPFRGAYRWHPGYWQRPPYEGGYYVQPHWEHYPDGWHQHEGYWAHEDHDPHYWDHYRH